MKLDELSQILRDVDPAAVLVPQTALSRVVQNVMGITWAVWSIPHSHCLSIDRATLHDHVEQEELYLPPDHQLPETVLILERPTGDQLAASKNSELLARYWRLLFHASVHRAIEHRLSGIVAAEFRERIERIGTVAFEEARNVLIEDNHLNSKADDRAAYIEFAAFFLELRFFASNLVSVYFPSLPPVAEVEAVLALDVDGAGLFKKTRLPGAPDPTPKTDDQSDESEDYYRRLTQSAERASATGDTVLAAILHTKAARVAPATMTKPAQTRAREAIYHLVARLQTALGLNDPKVEAAWREVLPTLLDKADQGIRPVEAAILYDLQRACLDAEQTIYTLDISEWLLSAFHKPIKRPLDSQRFVRIPEHVRSAIRRLAAARLTDADRQALGSLLRDALERAEMRLRERFRPVLTDALSDAGLKPNSLPEKAALEKTVEELLDKISSAGFLGYADLRDAISRGQMKLADLGGPDKMIRGDPLLKLDRRLAHLLDGVYRGAEPYTSALERMTSLAFGTDTGRWFTRNIVLPFGGAFLAAEFTWLLAYEQRRVLAEKNEDTGPSLPERGSITSAQAKKETVASKKEETDPSSLEKVNGTGESATKGVKDPSLLVKASGGGDPALKATVASKQEAAAPSFLQGWNVSWEFHLSWILLSFVILATIRSARFRTTLLSATRLGYRCLRTIFWDLPLRIWCNTVLQFLLKSVPVQLAINYVGKPLLICGFLWLISPSFWGTKLYTWLIVFTVSDIVINTRLGRVIDFFLLQTARKIIELIRAGPAVIHWVNSIFKDMRDALEWMMARAEDWLRIRGRSGTMTVIVKAFASILWTPFAFLIRFYTVVLIEPMINPLKLPLSILFAKFVYPLLAILGLFTLDPLDSPLVAQLTPILSKPIAWVLVLGTFYLSPDLVTYLFWEMRENWRLYRANHPDKLEPVAVGPYGETVEGLLHMSFHSGTVPRLYSRLRTAELEAAHTDVWSDARTYRQALRGVEESIRRFVMRDLVAVLNASPSWGERKLSVDTVLLGTNRIRVQLHLEGDAETCWLEWEDRSGWLVAGCPQTGFLMSLPPAAIRVFENTLAYLYKLAGVDLIREQIQTALPKEAVHFDFAPNGLLVWYGSRDTQPLLYDPDDPVEELRPRDPIDRHLVPGSTLDANRLVFGRLELTWKQWLQVWKAHDREEPPRFGPTDWDLTLLPTRKIDKANPALNRF